MEAVYTVASAIQLEWMRTRSRHPVSPRAGDFDVAMFASHNKNEPYASLDREGAGIDKYESVGRLLLVALTWARFFKILRVPRLTILRTKKVRLVKHPLLRRVATQAGTPFARMENFFKDKVGVAPAEALKANKTTLRIVNNCFHHLVPRHYLVQR
jgi:hypothetical protein